MASDAEEVKSKIDMVDFVQKYVPLKKAGINYSGLCPFHNEKSPSFMVSPERQSFKCFGCDEGGDVLDFVMKIEGLEFPEALKMLAEQVGVELKPFGGGSRDATHRVSTGGISKTRLYELNSFIASAWNQILLKHPSAQKARDYLTFRHLTDQTIREWQIGFAPPENVTRKLLSQRKFSDVEQREAGQPIRLAGRITFPINSMVGQVVGFTGRILEESQNGPKYWNTPETLIFHKGKTLFGLDKAKKTIREGDLALLVEGQMDVVTLHQAGFKMATATSGTALTDEHIKLLKRFTPNLVVAFDQDSAGEKATKKALEIAFAEDVIPSVIIVTEGKDPADAVTNNLSIWQQNFDDRRSFMDWLIDKSIKDFGVADGLAKKRIVDEILPWLARIKSPIERSHWQKELADRIQISETSIIEALEKMTTIPDGRDRLRPVPTTDTTPKQQLKPEILLIGLLSMFPKIITDVKTSLNFENLEENQKNILDRIIAWNEDTTFDQYIKKLDISMQKYISSAHLIASSRYSNISEEDAKNEILFQIGKIKQNQKEHIKSQFAYEIAQAEKTGNREKVKELIDNLQNAILQR